MDVIRHACVYAVMVSAILLFAGCSFVNYASHEEAQLDNTLESQSKTLVGLYKDIGSNGSINPHPESSGKMSQEPQSHATGAIILGGPAEVIDPTTFTVKKTGKPGGNKAGSSSGSNSTGSSRGASGADGQ